VGTLLVVLAGCADQAAPTTAQTSPNPPVPAGWTRLFDGVSLQNWGETDFGGQGTVEVKDGTLILGQGNDLTGVTWRGDFPKTNFEVSLQAMRVDGHDFFCGLTFPVKESFCSLIVGGWGGATVGLSSIDGQDASENETTRAMDFVDGRWYTIVVQVKDDAINAWIDGKQVVSQPLAGREISIRPEVSLSRPLGIATWRTTGALRDIRMRRLE